MKKHFLYLKYLLRHKWYVAVECWKHGLFLHAITHDLSKFRPSEWIPYARFFYGNYPVWDDAKLRCPAFPWSVRRPKWTKEGVSDAFDIAWLKHQRRNKHHWQYWFLLQDDGPPKLIPIPRKIILQMVCDWIGASKAINGKDADPLKWYEKVKDGMKDCIDGPSLRMFEQELGYKGVGYE